MQRKRADIFNKRMTLAVTLKIVRTNIVSLVIADFFLEAPCKTNGSRCSRASMRDAARGAIKCNSSTVNLFVSLWQRIFGATKRRIVSFHPSAIVTFQVCREAGEQKETGRQRHLSAETIKTLSADVFFGKTTSSATLVVVDVWSEDFDEGLSSESPDDTFFSCQSSDEEAHELRMHP